MLQPPPIPQNELAWRRLKQRQALVVADNGGGPPLCVRSPQHAAGVAGMSSLPAAAGALGTTADIVPQLLPTSLAYGHPFGTELLEPGQLR
jgi:hypothetical protein